MADVKLTPRQTAEILSRLDEGARNVEEARKQLILAMAERTVTPAAAQRKRPSPPARKRR